jgi:hypothetical protein
VELYLALRYLALGLDNVRSIYRCSGSPTSKPRTIYRGIEHPPVERKGIHVASAQLTKIDGHDAFVIIGTQAPIPGAPLASYHCFTAVIVDHQLINMEVFALGNPRRPPEFETRAKGANS